MKLNGTLIIVALEWAGALIAVNALELHFQPNFSSWALIVQNISIGIANAYHLVSISASPTGALTETTTTSSATATKA